MSHTVGYMSFGRDARAQTACRRNFSHLALVQNTTLEHYLKVVHTTYQLSRGKLLDTYQYTVNNNNYQDGASLPSEPLADAGRRDRSARPGFLTQICAIIGGVFGSSTTPSRADSAAARCQRSAGQPFSS